MKKYLSLALAAALALSMLGGCSKEEPAKSTPAASTPAASAPAASTPAAEPSGDGKVAMPAGFDKQNINWIVPAAAGAAIDIPSRGLIEALEDSLGANIVVENLAGASQTIGATEFTNREATGHNICTIAPACAFTQPLLTELNYDPLNDWRVISNFCPLVYNAIATRSGHPLKNGDEFIEFVKSGKDFTWGVANVASIGDLMMTSFLNELGVTSGTKIVYNGSVEMQAAMMSGELDFALVDDSVAVDFVENGEWTILVNMSTEPSALFPEANYASQYAPNFVPIPGIKWLAVKKGTPEEEVEWVKQQIQAGIESEAYQSFLDTAGFVGGVKYYTEEELTEWFKEIADACESAMKLSGMI